MDLAPVWILHQYVDSNYNPATVSSTTETVIGGGLADSNEIEVALADSKFGNYSSGLAWSMVTNNGEVVYVQSVGGNYGGPIYLTSKLNRPATSVTFRSISIDDIDRVAKVYSNQIVEDFDASITPDTTGLGPDKIGRHLFTWNWTAMFGNVIPLGWFFGGYIKINGTTLTQGVDFDIAGKLPGAFRDEVVSAINSSVPGVTAHKEGPYNIGLSGYLRFVLNTLYWKISESAVSNPVYNYNPAGFPPLFISKNLTVKRKLTIRGHLITDNRRRARKYRNALWNLQRVGWVDVYQAGNIWNWYIIRKIDITRNFSSQIESPRELPHKIMVYDYSAGAALNDWIKVNGTTLTAGTDFNAVTSNEVTATNMAAAITSGIAGVTATATENEIVLSGTVTQLSTTTITPYDWITVVGGKDRSYRYDVIINLDYAPPANHKDYRETK